GQIPPLPPAARPQPPAELSHGSRDGLDRRKAERLSRGKLPIEATLDLHGLRQAEAHRRLESFLADSQAAGKRCVLVVTGKGLHKEEAGVLRSAVPRWLNEQPNRARVLSFDYAQPRHGGTGGRKRAKGTRLWRRKLLSCDPVIQPQRDSEAGRAAAQWVLPLRRRQLFGFLARRRAVHALLLLDLPQDGGGRRLRHQPLR